MCDNLRRDYSTFNALEEICFYLGVWGGNTCNRNVLKNVLIAILLSSWIFWNPVCAQTVEFRSDQWKFAVVYPSFGSSSDWFEIELEFRNFGFCGGRKTGQPGERHSEHGQKPTTKNSTHIWRELGIWIRATVSALTTASSFLLAILISPEGAPWPVT